MCKDVSKELLHLYVTKLFGCYSLMHFFLLYNIYNNVYGNTNILLLQIDVKTQTICMFSLSKVLVVQEKVIPLHPLSRMNETSSKTILRSVREGDKESLTKLSAMKLASIAETQPSL